MNCDRNNNNRSGNRPFEDILRARLSRRKVLALSATSFLAALAGHKTLGRGTSKTLARGSSLMDFPIVPATEGTGPVPNISSAYEYEVLIPWGTPIQPGGPTYDGDPKTRPTAAEQAQQVGIGHDGMWFFPIENRSDRGMLAINHEFGRNPHVLGKPAPTSLEEVLLSQHAHGVAVVEIAKIDGRWQTVNSDKARRIHVNTPVTFSGPVAGHALLKTPAGNAPLGTVNNCANGYTPWGTYLTCEENFNAYFGATGSWTPTEAQRRYGFRSRGSGYGWENFDPRFDLSNPNYANEENRFGWVVEIDPMDASQTPVKRTALGRLKHENAALVVGAGDRAVVYMGDDEGFDYIYKFVSAGNWRSMRDSGESPLDRGTLYVARFNEDGTGNWIELTLENPALKAKFKDRAEVLTYTRLAADAVGATPMDRPEWIAVAPNGDVYCNLTNNSGRGEAGLPGADAANPLAPNRSGHIIKWHDSNTHIGTTFTWEIFILARDTHGADDERRFSSPDGLWADPDGRLFIETDGFQQKGLNNQLLVADPKTDAIRRLLSGVRGCEITGIAVTPDRKTMFVNIQHPGNGNPAETNFPAPQGSGKIPRDATLAIARKDGGIVGS